ncbi:hypothetical protein [Paenibacillus wenxiniae]|uniref:Enamine deaminase RidA, house cleaning of reactive enamine intermediates, YjgF/YER057c/UK114 family n=1 Tax=Paenibacillus wenxiniae TaxID=1636843 RepID=A0ABW4RK90_9BACL
MSSENITVKKLEQKDYVRHYLTLNLNKAYSIEQIEKEYKNAYQYFIDLNMDIVYEKCFGLLNTKNKLSFLREEISNHYNIQLPPLSYIEGTPAYGTALSSITIYGIHKKDKNVQLEYITNESGGTIGTKVITSQMEYIYLMNINNVHHSYTMSEFAATFAWLGDFMKKNELLGPHLVRTWIYLNDINNNYEQLNTDRRVFFERFAIDYSEKSNILPASTCIGGISDKKCNISMDVMFLKRKNDRPIIERVYTALLNEAEGVEYLFKPTFSRALKIEDEGNIEIQLSGTASVNSLGRTEFKNDAYKQIKKALENVTSILESNNLTFDHFYQSTCFFKRQQDVHIFEKLLKELNIPAFANTFVVNDVCRDDLLFEIDGIIIK